MSRVRQKGRKAKKSKKSSTWRIFDKISDKIVELTKCQGLILFGFLVGMKNAPSFGRQDEKTHFERVDNMNITRLPYHGPKESQRERTLGWLHMWWIAEPGEQPPSRRQYCEARSVNGIVKYWQKHTFALMQHKFVPDTPSVLDTILAPEKKSVLQIVLEG